MINWIKKWGSEVFIQKYVLKIALFLIYFLVLGPTSVVTKLLFRFSLSYSLSKVTQAKESNWSPVSNLEDNLENSENQS